MPDLRFLFRNRLGVPGRDHALLLAVVALLLLGLSGEVRASLAALAAGFPGPIF